MFGLLNDNDWNQAKIFFSKYLDFTTTTVLSGSYYNTSTIFFRHLIIEHRIKKGERTFDPLLYGIAVKMREIYNKFGGVGQDQYYVASSCRIGPLLSVDGAMCHCC